jgi:hypothetical protein
MEATQTDGLRSNSESLSASSCARFLGRLRFRLRLNSNCFEWFADLTAREKPVMTVQLPLPEPIAAIPDG